MNALRRIASLLLLLSILVLTLASCGFEGVIPDFSEEEEEDKGELYSEMQETVTVSVSDGDFYTVTSSNPLRVMKGADASFKIEFNDKFEFSAASDGAVYEDGHIIVKAVEYPTTVKVFAKKSAAVVGGGGGNANSGGENNGSALPDGMIKVTLLEDESITVLSAAEVYIMNGESATFKIEVEEGYEISKVKGGKYSGGYIVTDPLYEDTKITVTVKKKSAVPTTETLVLTEPDELDGMHFVCWTLKKPLDEGGSVLTTEKTGEFEVPIGTSAVANYVDDAHYLVVYRLNGGKTADGKNYYCQLFSNEHFLMPNTIAADGTFVRDGYTILRYTENEDGSGDYTTTGGKITPNENGFVELWVQWAEQKDTYISFSIYEEDEILPKYDIGGKLVDVGKIEGPFAAVTLVTGSESRVVIPEYVDYYGKQYPVKKISEGAFNKHRMRDVVLPSTLEVIEDRAFLNCTNLWTLTMFDRVRVVTDASFAGCDSLKTCYLNAALPTVKSGEDMFVRKYERLRMAQVRGEKKILLVSGSSSLYGFSARQMQETFDNEYTVINYGTNAGAGSTFYMDVFSRFLDEGDILLHAPEMANTAQLGDAKFYRLTFRGCTRMQEVFSYADLTKYEDFFDAYIDYVITQREGFEAVTYENYREFIDDYSDMVGNIDKPNYQTQGPNSVKICYVDRLTDERMSTLNRICAKVRDRGAEMYLTFGPINYESVHVDSLDALKQAEYEDALREKLDYELISCISDYILERRLFNNSDHHPGIEGCGIRTERLTADLKAQLEKEGK